MRGAHRAPQGCFDGGNVRTLAAWCEPRQVFHALRVGHPQTVHALPDRFAEKIGHALPELTRMLRTPAHQPSGDSHAKLSI